MYYGQTGPMGSYERQIRYLDFCENGQRQKGAGFLKIEKQDNLCNINLQVSGLYRKDRLVRPFLLLGSDKENELCKLQLADGGIKLYLEGLNCDNLDGKGMTYQDLTGIRIPISESKEICCLWGQKEEKTEIYAKESEQDEFIPLQELVPRVEIDTVERDILERDILEKDTLTKNQLPKNVSEESSPVIMDSKWEQLWAIYPHTTPFSDAREYIAVGPGDFVVLGEKHFKLANNSFLLHGYYNYQHLILTRIRERNQMRYYIGVPGVFLEREKKTAIMFGFQSFECETEPAGEGDFGYYMIPVEL